MAHQKTITVSGAGPAGLAAALHARHLGHQAIVFERRKDVGIRFHGDFQGLENWTSEHDVLLELESLGIRTDFDYLPFHRVTCFDPVGKAHVFHSRRPLFYLLKRGRIAGSLDYALKQQALDAGIDIHFGQSIRQLPQGGIVTHGPQRADVIAAGFLFDTDMPDGAWAVVNNDLAPGGYGYVLVAGGKGTLASCMYADFHRERNYVSRVVEFFEQAIGLDMQSPRRFGGAGNAVIHHQAHKGNIFYAGEAAGIQDALFGFGMRWAMLSGAMAARALLDGDADEYEHLLDRRIRRAMQASEVNRWLYQRLGNRGYRWVLNRHRGQDAGEWLQRGYRPRRWTSLAYRLPRLDRKPPFLPLDHDCDCTWCKCQHAAVNSV